MATVLALEKLYDDVLARFTAEGQFGTSPSAAAATARANPFGWREPNRQGGPTSRIVWMPGDERGTAGAIVAAKYPGRLDPGRPLATLNELFTCFISAQDPTQPRVERAQWKATRLLYDVWYRAVYLAAYGTFEIISTRWDTYRDEHRFGATLIVTGAIQSMIQDTTPTLAPADVVADITVTELDLSETETAP